MPPRDLDVPPGGLVIDLRLVADRRADHQDESRLYSWIAQAREADEPCFVIDTDLQVRSVAAAALAILQPAQQPVGQRIVPALFDLVDADLLLGDRWQLPPIVAVRAGHHARALARCRRADGVLISVDVVGVPLRDRRRIVGAVGFISQIHPAPGS